MGDDKELQVMGRVARALAALPTDEARCRVLAFFSGKHSPVASDALHAEAAKQREAK